MTDGDDILDRAAELDRRIMAIPEDKVFTKRAVTVGFTIVCALLVALLAVVLSYATSTNTAVTETIPGLKRQVEQRDQTIADQQDVLNQAVQAITTMSDQITALGGEPPEVVLCPRNPDTGECR